jgi:hypothetical protein
MPYQIKGERREHELIGNWTKTAKVALKLALEWASQGIVNITIINQHRYPSDIL